MGYIERVVGRRAPRLWRSGEPGEERSKGTDLDKKGGRKVCGHEKARFIVIRKIWEQ
jgi:hypothetical protein